MRPLPSPHRGRPDGGRRTPAPGRVPTPALLALTLLALLTACGPDGTTPPAGPATPPHVLVITLDTLRPDRLGCYGYERDTSPHLDAFAEQSVLFEQAFSNSSFTPPSHASILTGRFPGEHGLMHWSQTLADVPTAADLFAAAGYRTLAISPLKTLFKIGLSRGFETLLEPPHREGDGLYYLADAETINRDVLPHLTGAATPGDERPVFAWLHYYDAHRVFGRQGREWAQRYNDSHDVAVGDTEQWYQLRAESHKGKLPQGALSPADVAFMEDRYDGGLAYLDAQLGRLFERLEATGVLERSIVVITADHGEVFAEHDEEWFSHDPHLVDENVHVPLLIRLPDGAHAGERRDTLVQGVDLLPTLLELAGVDPGSWSGSGLSLVPALEGRPLRRDALFADRMGADWTVSPPPRNLPEPTPEQIVEERDRKRMVRTASHKLIINMDRGTASLFAVDDEQTNLYGADDDLTRRMTGLYQAQVGRLREVQRESVELDPETEAYLRGLGYIGDDVDLGALTAEPDDGPPDDDQ